MVQGNGALVIDVSSGIYSAIVLACAGEGAGMA